MSRYSVRVLKIDPFRRHYTPLLLSGANLLKPVQRQVQAKQLGWFELCRIDSHRLMGTRPSADGRTNETYDAGPMPLIVAADAIADDGVPGFRFRGIGRTTVGHALLFGQGVGGAMTNCPVGTEWLERHLIWMTAEEADAETDETIAPVEVQAPE